MLLDNLYTNSLGRFSHIFHTIGEINTGNARFHAQFQVDLQSFDQNILSFKNGYF